MAVTAPRPEVLHYSQRFDATAALLLERRLRELRDREVLVDLSAVSEIDDVTVAVLSRVLGMSSDGRVRIQGLRAHQERLLRYFGVRVERDGRVRPDIRN